MVNSNLRSGVIIKAVSGFYYVSSSDMVFECKARGNFRHSRISPIVGDRVKFNVITGDKGVLLEVLPRKNFLNRPLIANIDKIIIVSSFENPAPDLYLIDRMTAIAAFNNIEPVIVFNKSDMGDFSKFSRIYKNAGFSTYVVSASDTNTLVEFKKEFENCICAMSGNTGVGKSSLINSLFSGFDLKTGDISRALGRGRHTTRHTQLFANSVDGFVADTPGFSSIEQNNNLYDFKLNLSQCFRDFIPYLDRCVFSSCTHTCEPGCGILEAVNTGNIEKTRHDNYVTLFNELKTVASWQSK